MCHWDHAPSEGSRRDPCSPLPAPGGSRQSWAPLGLWLHHYKSLAPPSNGLSLHVSAPVSPSLVLPRLIFGFKAEDPCLNDICKDPSYK